MQHPHFKPSYARKSTSLTRVQGNRSQRGTTLLEAMVVVSVTAISLGLALPGMAELIEGQRLRALTALVETDLQFARSTAVAEGQTVRLTFASDVGSTCYVIHTGPAGSCSCAGASVSAPCQNGSYARRVATLAGMKGVSLSSNVRSMAFSPSTGTVTPTGTLRLRSERGDAINLVVNVMGRVRSCSPSGVSGQAQC